MAKITYPPILSSTIPAVRAVNDWDEFIIPFQHNPAVSPSTVTKYYMRIRELSGTSVCTLSTNVALNSQLRFIDTAGIWCKVGQYYRIQIAYATQGEDSSSLVWSTPATFKYIGTASVAIDDLDINTITTNNSSFVGRFSCQDKQEKIYSYRFIIRDDKGSIVKDSGTLIHNNLSINNDIDSFELLETFEDDSIKYYTVQYTITTINGLTLSTPEYKFQIKYLLESLYEQGYFNLSLDLNNENGYIDIIVSRIEIESNTSTSTDTNTDVDNTTDTESNTNTDTNTEVDNTTDTSANPDTESGTDTETNTSTSTGTSINNATIDGTFKVVRSSDNGKTWREIGRLKISQVGFQQAKFRDRTIEHGQTYIYALQEYYQKLVSRRFPRGDDELRSEVVNLEHCFLSDGERQLKVKFDPKISSFKTTLQESKTATLGNKYPYFFRNGMVGYKEFPINGLISQLMDEEGLFAAARFMDQSPRTRTEAGFVPTAVLPAAATNLSGENMYNENQFKHEVLNWLNNGKPKYFRSAAEGNYIVQLMSTTLSPNDTLGRMLHSFSTQATEVKENNYTNLLEMGLYDLTLKDDFVDSSLAYFGSISLANITPGQNILQSNDIKEDQIQNMFLEDCADGDVFILNGIEIRIGKTGSYYYNGLVNSLFYKGYEGIYGERPSDSTTSKFVYKMQGQITTMFKLITNYATTVYPMRQFIGSEYVGIDDGNILSEFNMIKYNFKIYYLRFYVDDYLNPQGTDTRICINDQIIELQPEGTDLNKRHYYELMVPDDLEIHTIILGDKTVCEMYCEVAEKRYGFIEDDVPIQDLAQKLEISSEVEAFVNSYKFKEAYTYMTQYLSPMLTYNSYIKSIANTLGQNNCEAEFNALKQELLSLQIVTNDSTIYKPINYWKIALNNYNIFIQSLYIDYLTYEIERRVGVNPDDNTTTA